MKRAISSKNEVFLSIVDLLMLLLFSFLALAFRVSHAGAKQHRIDLPIVVATGKRGSDETPTADTVYVAWARADDVAGAEGALCSIAVREKSMSAPAASTSAPCLPGAFRGGQQAALSEMLRSVAERGFRAVVVCPVGTTSFEACARLQWVLAEHGFTSVAAAVVTSSK